MPLLDGHHGQRHHLVTSMRTKEFLKLYYPYLVHDHQLLFNSKGLDVDGTPPDDLVDYIHRLRLREPEEAPLIIFAKACRQQSDGIDSSSATDFHRRLVDAERMEDAAKCLSVQGVKLSFASYPSGSLASFETLISNKQYIAERVRKRSFLLPLPLRACCGSWHLPPPRIQLLPQRSLP